MIITAKLMSEHLQSLRQSVADAIEHQAMFMQFVKQHSSYSEDTFPEGFDWADFAEGVVSTATEEYAEQITVFKRSMAITAFLVQADVPEEHLLLDYVAAEACRCIQLVNTAMQAEIQAAENEQVQSDIALKLAVDMAQGTYQPKADIFGAGANIDAQLSQLGLTAEGNPKVAGEV